MNTISILLFLSSDKSAAPQAVTMDTDQPQELEKLTLNHAPLALVVRAADLDYFRSMTDVVMDVGTKDKDQQLSRYMLNRSFRKAPLIEAPYKEGGQQAGRSIRTLLANAEKIGEANLFIIGVPEAVFTKLAKGAVKPKEQRDEKIAWQADDDLASDSLLRLMPPLEGEAALESRYLGRSHQHDMVRRLIMYAAKCPEPVLILGETGTGKGLVARLIHEMSSFSEHQPMVTINCAGLPEGLIESELFGHVKGAFTGAASDRAGLWEAAGDGILFLDEIGDMPLGQQAKVLRALQEGVIRKVGSTKQTKVRARVLAATNQDLYSMMRGGAFREDLYFRLRGFMIQTPPVRKHPANIPFMINQLWREMTQGNREDLSPSAVAKLQSYSWPGNMGEMRRFLAVLHYQFAARKIMAEHIEACFRLQGMGEYAPSTSGRPAKAEDLILHRAQCLRHLKRVAENLVASQINLQKIIAAKGRGKEIGALRDELRRTAAELAALCAPEQRLLFYGENLKSLICELSTKTFAFSCGLAGESASSLTAWAKQTGQETEKAEDVVLREIGNIVGQA